MNDEALAQENQAGVRDPRAWFRPCTWFVAAKPGKAEAINIDSPIAAAKPLSSVVGGCQFRLQRSFADGWIDDEGAGLWESWMRHADQMPGDLRLELMTRCQKSKTCGRPSTTAEVALLLKHIRGWSLEASHSRKLLLQRESINGRIVGGYENSPPGNR